MRKQNRQTELLEQQLEEQQEKILSLKTKLQDSRLEEAKLQTELDEARSSKLPETQLEGTSSDPAPEKAQAAIACACAEVKSKLPPMDATMQQTVDFALQSALGQLAQQLLSPPPQTSHAADPGLLNSQAPTQAATAEELQALQGPILLPDTEHEGYGAAGKSTAAPSGPYAKASAAAPK